jgi:hypothetical protein
LRIADVQTPQLRFVPGPALFQFRRRSECGRPALGESQPSDQKGLFGLIGEWAFFLRQANWSQLRLILSPLVTTFSLV